MLHLSADNQCDISATESEGLWEQGGAGGGIFHCDYFLISSPDVRSHIPNHQELTDPHTVQSSFHIAGLRYSAGNLHFSSLRPVILITTEHFSFWVKVVLSCSAQQDCWGFFGSVCCKPQQRLFGVWIACTPLCWTKTVAKVPSGCSRSKQCCTQ